MDSGPIKTVKHQVLFPFTKLWDYLLYTMSNLLYILDKIV